MAINYRRGPALHFDQVIDYFFRSDEQTVERACDGFIAYVDPDPELDAQKERFLNGLMLEWFIFDYLLPSGLTPLEEYVQHNPEGRGGIALGRFKQAAQTQFCADFVIKEASASKSLLVLETLEGGEEYRVLEYAASQQLDGQPGILGMRLVQVDGDWLTAGNPVYYFPVQPTDRMLAMMREESEGESRSFIDMVKTHFGVRDQREPVDLFKGASAV